MSTPGPTGTTAAQLGLRVGLQIALQEVEWSKADRNIVLAVRTTCGACNDSAIFYRALFDKCTETSGCRAHVIAPEDVDIVRDWLAQKHIRAASVIHIEPTTELGLHLTPTIAVVDPAGVITDLAVGILSSQAEDGFLLRVAGDATNGPINTEPSVTIVDLSRDLPSVLQQVGISLVDVRPYSACVLDGHPDAVCLPLDDIPSRVGVLIPVGARIVVDCSRIPSQVCLQATKTFALSGFRGISAAVVSD